MCLYCWPTSKDLNCRPDSASGSGRYWPRNSKKQNADRPAGHELPIPKSFRVSTGHEKSDSRVDLFSGGTAGAQTIGQFTRFSGVAFEPRGDCEGSVSEIYFLRPKSRKLSLAFSLQCWRGIRNGVIGRIVGTPEISLRCSGTTACASGRFESLDVTLAYLRSKDAESEEAQEHANSSSLALYA